MSLSTSSDSFRAELSVVPEGHGIAVYLESRGGRGRNPDYNLRLLHILQRLGSISATIPEITVESTRVAGLSREERLLDVPGYGYPIQLRPALDFEELRLAIGAAQEGIGQAVPSPKGGNRTKRIRIGIVPGSEHSTRSVADWAAFFAAPMDAPQEPALTVLTDVDAITAAHQRFQENLVKGAKAVGHMPLGFQGGQLKASVFHQPELDLWMGFEREPNRYWNAFGLGMPSRSYSASIVAEINSPYSGIHRGIAGAFAADADGQVYIVHRGRIGGGRPGLSKPHFVRYYEQKIGPLELVRDGDQTTPVILIGAIDDPRLPALTAQFVRAVHDFKNDPATDDVSFAPVPSTRMKRDFSPEFSGQKAYATRARVVADCTHGLIVNTLQRMLADRGFLTANDQYRDLIILDSKGRRRVIFEVKPTSQPYSIYQAVGQLFLHTTDEPNVARVAVLPEGLAPEMAERLRKLRIQVVQFGWEGQRLTFHNCEAFDRLAVDS